MLKDQIINAGNIEAVVIEVKESSVKLKFNKIEWKQFAKHIYVGDEVEFKKIEGWDSLDLYIVPQSSPSDRYPRGGGQIQLYVYKNGSYSFDLDS